MIGHNQRHGKRHGKAVCMALPGVVVGKRDTPALLQDAPDFKIVCQRDEFFSHCVA